MKTGKINRIVLIILAAAAVCVSAAVCFLLHENMQRVSEITLPADVKESDEIMFEITKKGTDKMTSRTANGMAQVGAGKKYLTVEGWAGVPGEDVGVFHTVVLLQEDSGKYLKLKTSMISGRESPDADNGGVSFANGWFVAKVKKDALEPGKKYPIYLWYQNDGHNELVKTGKALKVKV